MFCKLIFSNKLGFILETFFSYNSLFQNIPRNRVEAVQQAIATQDPPKEKRDKEILEEDYKSYESKDADNVPAPIDQVMMPKKLLMKPCDTVNYRYKKLNNIGPMTKSK